MLHKWEYRIETINDVGSYLISGAKWNYQTGTMETPSVWGKINDLGAIGWEMVSVGPWEDSSATAVFKRSIEEIAEKTEIDEDLARLLTQAKKAGVMDDEIEVDQDGGLKITLLGGFSIEDDYSYDPRDDPGLPF